MHAPTSNLLPFLVVIPIIIWRLYGRIRRSIGRQTLSKVRPWITIGVFPLLVAAFAYAAARSHPQALGWLAGAALAGTLLGVFGLSRTKFEVTPQGLFYTPNAHLGIALSLLLVGRVLYRMITVYVDGPEAARNGMDFARSPVTLALFGLLAGYYVAYAIGLVRWRRRVERGQPPAPANPQ